ncbi:Transcription initiation factor IIF subunit beta [Wickerhamomyces ciferrii]|uniref:Transcription initiation factor IIF subunit beta n=1 Tax=Wickerhamomyces ciferrii (strain ATCC 14091 / BCRC 22168 / CBS 111 / JCM 3599 / NBRC 0793 / NRRL Y-1031 F-60-10) TaxID=1206466 RepID=K0L0W5_WICCF|nr:Transcription initiation factor IIF subunit beta [Wickerhamomyces ciferrii]CCH47093.1 Transcription initiation factor IIF subunit beta [Wickerhamomyces ciferrii]
MTTEPTKQKTKSNEQTPAAPEQELSKEQTILQKQQLNEGSDEEYVSENEEVIDSNDITQDNNRIDLNMNLDNGERKIWLVRLPRFLIEKWKESDNYFQGQDLGKIKIKQNNVNNKAPYLKMQLNENDPNFEDIPHNYELNMTKPTVENQYIFNEQNVNGLKRQNGKQDEDDNTNHNGGVKKEDGTVTKNELDNEVQSKKPELKPIDKREAAMLRRRRRFNRYKNRDGTDKVIPFVKTIPKKTSLIGKIAHECQITPMVNDPNYSKIIQRRKNLIKEEPRPTVTLLNEIPGVTLSNAGLTLKTDTSKFLKSSASTKNKNEGRAIRMPQKDLFDLLFKLFDEYDYWSLKGLKERTKQPEVYLKETLEQIAQLIKKGPYALKYALKREFKELKDQERAERLGELSKENEEDDDEEDNDEDVEMEDVV